MSELTNVTVNGIRLAEGSPLLTKAGVRRKVAMSESAEQIHFVTLCVGASPKRRPGSGLAPPRTPGGGMTTRYPDLALLYAVPNGGHRGKAAAGRMKAEGILATIPDLCLPVARGPYCGLYLEFKATGEYGTKAQREMHERLRAQGYAVFEVMGCEEAMQVTMGYLALPTLEAWFSAWAGEPLKRVRDRLGEELRPKRGRE